MKKLFIGAIALSGLMMSSCDMGSGKNESTVAYDAYNLVVPMSGEAPSISPGRYLVHLDFNDYTASVSTNTLMINNKAYSFVSDPDKYKGDTFFSSMPLDGVFNNGEMSVSGKFQLVAYNEVVAHMNDKKYFETFKFNPTYKTSEGKIAYIPGTFFPVSTSQGFTYIYPCVFANYTIGSQYLVRTFMTDTFYGGTTTTSYNGEHNTSKDMVYRVIIDIEKKKAGVVIYDAKFSASPNEKPKTAIYIPGLDFKADVNGIQVTGTDIVPLIPEGSSASTTLPDPDTFTPYENFKFDSFNMTTGSSFLNTVSITYRVAGKYDGSFSGSCTNLQPLSQQ